MQELDVINNLLGGYQVFFDALGKMRIQEGMSVCDWGCGGGDSLRAIANWARRKGLKLDLIGIDATKSALDYARERSSGYPEIRYIQADVMSDDIVRHQFDIVISSLFTHHFPDESWIGLVRKMADSATYRVIINDLHRHWFAYYSIGVLTSILSKSEMIKHDSKVSVLRSFKKQELQNLLDSSFLHDYHIKWKWAFRWQVVINTEGFNMGPGQ